MPTFDFPTLFWWGLPVVTAPLVIHLINLLRQRRVKFAALEFLLASQRRYRTRVLLRQILLLALRTAIVLGLVLALAQPRWRQAIGGLLGAGRTAHVVLLDDTVSMADTTGAPAGDEGRAFDRGRRFVERLVEDAVAEGGAGEFTCGRFSAVAPGGAGFDLQRRPLDRLLLQEVRSAIAGWLPGAFATPPAQPLAAVAGFVEGGDAARIVWLVSDFRARDWQGDDEMQAALRRLVAAGAELRFVDCGLDGDANRASPGRPAAGNLTLERLEMAGGVPAVGVSVPFEVTVRNDGTGPARDVAIDLAEDGMPRPGLTITEIVAGGTASRRFDARFTAAGPHLVAARLPPDVLLPDDARSAVVDVVERVDVLVIDGDPRGGRDGDAFYVATAVAPGGAAPTGIRPRIEQPRALASLDLATFDCIFMLDVERLDASEVAAVEDYVRAGGGIVFFTGPRTRAEIVNQTLYRAGAGVFPAPLAGSVDLLPDPAGAGAPDLVAEEHPAVAVLSGQRNPLLDAVRVERFTAVERTFAPAPGSGFRRLLSLRNGMPLAVERPFGAGMAVAVLTTAAPTWNNWARGNPSWVVVLLELEGRLARGRRRATETVVGDDLAVQLEQGVDEIEVDFIVPPQGTVVRQTAVAAASGPLEARLRRPREPGGYAARWRRLDGTERERLFAVNVVADEGRLRRIDRPALARALPGIPFRFEAAESPRAAAAAPAGMPLVKPLLALLLALLVGEQLLARAAGYHAPTARRRPVFG
jgi:hypothetical protein